MNHPDSSNSYNPSPDGIDLMPPIHPGEVLHEEFMIPYGLSSNALAQRLDLTTTRINEIVRKKRGITAETALLLARCFATSPEFWLNLQRSYDLDIARRKLPAHALDRVRPVTEVALNP